MCVCNDAHLGFALFARVSAYGRKWLCRGRRCPRARSLSDPRPKPWPLQDLTPSFPALLPPVSRRVHQDVGLLRECVVKRGGTAGVLNQRASEKEREPVTRNRQYTGTRPSDTGNANRHRHRETRTNVYMYISQQND